MADDSSEMIGGVSVGIRGDFSDLGADFEAAVALAVSQGQTLAEAIQSAMATPDVTPVTDALNTIAPAAQAAAEQMNLFGAAADNIPFADAAGQLNMFTTELEPFAGATQSAAQATADLASKTSEIKPAAEEAASGTSNLLKSLLQFAGIDATIEGVKDALLGTIAAFATVQTASLALEFLGDSSREAAGEIQKLRDLAMELHVPFDQLVMVNQRFQALGLTIGESAAMMRIAADGSAIMGKSLEANAFALQRMAVDGVVMRRSVESLGFSMADLAQAMNVTASEATKAFKAIGDGRTEAEATAARIEILTEAAKRHAGAAAAMGVGVTGAWQDMKNATNQTAADIGGTVGGLSTLLLHFGTDVAQQWHMIFTEIGKTLGTVAPAAEVAAHHFTAMGPALSGAALGAAQLQTQQATLNEALTKAQAVYAALVESAKEGGASQWDVARALAAVTQASNAAYGPLEKVAAVHFKAIPFDVSSLGPAYDALIAKHQALEQQIKATAKEMEHEAEITTIFGGAFDHLNTSLPVVTDAMMKLGVQAKEMGVNTSEILGADGGKVKAGMDAMAIAATAALAPFKQFDQALKDLGKGDESNELAKYNEEIKGLQYGFANGYISAQRLGEGMKEAFLQAHPDMKRAGEDVQQLVQDMADLKTAFAAGYIDEKQFNQGMLADMEKLSPAVKQLDEEMKQMFNSINSAIASDLVHWKGLESSILSIGQAIATDTIKILITALFGPMETHIATMVVTWVAAHLHIGAAAVASSTTAAAAATAGAASSTLAVTAAAKLQVLAWASVAAAAAAAAVAGIPIVGPALAPGAAATTFADTAAYEAFAEGGTVSGPAGSPQMILAHGGETVFTADQMSGRVALPSVGGSSSSFSSMSSMSSTAHHTDNSIHFHGPVSGVTKDMVADVMNGAIKQSRRTGAKW
jgi:hypothetical protein